MRNNQHFHSMGLFLATFIISVCLSCYGGAGRAYAAGESQYATYTGNNVEAQDYSTWSQTVNSYLTNTAGGYMRLQAGIDDKSKSGYLVEYYDTAYHLLRTMWVPQELPIWGAFYETEDHYYILSGQENPNESNDVEVYRITQYDKGWNRINSCSLYGANTSMPFDAGSARMTHSGNQLVILTCHEMYASEDGYNHQANVIIQVDTSDMKIVGSYTEVMNIGYGYVSHSFNQFVGIDTDGHIVAINHGDAYPRGIAWVKYPKAVSEGFSYRGCNFDTLVSFTGETGDNSTGASVGGFAISDSAYIVAGNQNKADIYDDEGRNIFVVSKSKATGEVVYRQITNYPAGKGASTPHLVSIAANCYLLLWSQGNKVHYTEIDGMGQQIGTIYDLAGNLSDCAPIVGNGKIIWYTCDEHKRTFYEIDAANLSVTHTYSKAIPAEKGEIFFVKKVKAIVKVTSDNTANPTVQYVERTDKSKKVKVPDEVTYEGVTYKVTSVGKGAFTWDRKLTTVTVGKNVKSIGKNAFAGCPNLKSVTIRSTKLTKIDSNAFRDDPKLTKITLKTKILKKKSIGKNVLKGTSQKLKIKVPKEMVKKYKKYFKGKGNKNVKVTK